MKANRKVKGLFKVVFKLTLNITKICKKHLEEANYFSNFFKGMLLKRMGNLALNYRVLFLTHNCKNLTDSTSKSSSCECSNYKFRLTPVGGNFGEARQMCQTLGGDLISKNLGPEGKHYHG